MKSAATDYGTYYFHADHLGSSNVITNKTGNFHEHVEYMPFGETWVEVKTADSIDLPYRFTGKELDAESGLYYFGARYYDPKLSRWTAADPPIARGDYLPKPGDFDTDHNYFYYSAHDSTAKLKGHGGVFNPINLDAYHYAGQNPVKFVDPDGNDFILLNKSDGALGFGHNAALVGNDKTGWRFFSKNGVSKKDQQNFKYQTLAAFIKANNEEKNELNNNYDGAFRVKTDEKTDKKMIAEGEKIINRKYHVVEKKDSNGKTIQQNCSDLTADIGQAGDISISKPKIDTIIGKITMPNLQFYFF